MTADAAHWAVESWVLALGVFAQPLPVAKSAQVLLPPSSSSMPPPPVAETLIAGRYRDNGDGTVTDVQTSLQWMRCSLGQEWKGGACTGEASTYTWQKALDATEALNRQGGYAGYRDWRVPTIEELKTLIDPSGSPKINQLAFPNTLPLWYWSSSTVAYGPVSVWGVYFDYGSVDAYDKSYGCARLVRGRQ